MAQEKNKKCARFFSRFSEEKSEGVNFFAQKLVSSTTYYCFPPPSYVGATLLHFLNFGAHGLILVPFWMSAQYWSALVPDGVHLVWGVKSFLRFRPSGFVVDEGVLSGTFRGNPTFDMLGLEVDFFHVRKEQYGLSHVVPTSCLSFGCDLCRDV